MNPKDLLFSSIQRALNLPTDPVRSNSEIIGSIQSLANEFGLKSKIQKISHSLDGVAADLSNIVVFSGDDLVDRSTKRGTLFVSPLDAVHGTQIPEQKFWQQGDRIIGTGALQGRVDFFCRFIAMAEILSGRRHKNPVYVAGLGASYLGGLGARYFAGSSIVNPKHVIGFAPVGPAWAASGLSETGLRVGLSFPARPKDTKGYSRRIDIKVISESTTWANHSDHLRGIDLLFALLLEGSSSGFDFQWSKLDILGPKGCPTDFIACSVYVSTFQYEDFKSYIQNWIHEKEAASCFQVDFVGESQNSGDFLLPELIEAILEVDLQIQDLLETNAGELIGGIHSASHKSGKLEIDLQFQAYDSALLVESESRIKDFFKKMNLKNRLLTVQIQRQYLLPSNSSGSDIADFPFVAEGAAFQRRVQHYSDLGVFTQTGAKGVLTGLDNPESRILSLDECVTTAQIEEMYNFYEKTIQQVSQ